MAEHGIAFVLVVLAWWASTGAILLLCALPKPTFGWTMTAASLVLVAALIGLVMSSKNLGVVGVYLGFFSALAIWGWIEMSFLMGYVTGPRKTPCPADATGWRRFGLAVQTLLYHDLFIVGAAIALVLLTWKAPNQTGTNAFLILAAMRISAQLNIFLGVPNLTDEFLPARLAYLKSYFRRDEFSALFPVSVSGATFLAIVLAQRALGAVGAEAIGIALLFSLLALAILEHVFMIIPLPDAILWRWALRPQKTFDKSAR
jgi:putative photosynthetic complex assembly protein 2